jgi:hypothetical protein
MTSKTLVIYHFFQKDLTYTENFFHFIRFGYSASLDYVVIVAGNYTVTLPQFNNLKYVFTENKNHDYGGYAHVIKSEANLLTYDFFVFINSSVRGPYMPAYSGRCWAECFTDHLVGDVGLVGSTINILSAQSVRSKFYRQTYGEKETLSHVQTMAYALSRKALMCLMEHDFYGLNDALSKNEVIRDYEIRMSQMVMACRFNIKCLLPEYNLIDYRVPHRDANPTSKQGDPSFSHAYFGRTVHPFEVIFVKTNRQLFSQQYLNRLAYSAFVLTPTPSGLLENPSFIEYASAIGAVSTSVAEAPFNPQRSARIRLARLIPKPLRPFWGRLCSLVVGLTPSRS